MRKLILALFCLFIGTAIYAQGSCFTVTDKAGTVLSEPFAICDQVLPLGIVPTNSGGTFDPNNVGFIGNTFHPTNAIIMANNIFAVTYVEASGNVCVITIEVLTPSVDVTMDVNIGNSYCIDDSPIPLSGNADALGAVFLINNTPQTELDPSKWTEGISHLLQYVYTDPNGCSGIDSLDFFINPAPDTRFTGLVDRQTVCLNEGVFPLNGLATNGSFEGNGITITGKTFDPTLAGIGTHTLTYVVSESEIGTCNEGRRIDFSVEVVDDVFVDFQSITNSNCYTVPDTIVYTGDNPGPNADFVWTFSNGALTFDGGDTIVIRWDSPDNNNVNLEILNGFCSNMMLSQNIPKTGVTVEIQASNTIIDSTTPIELTTVGTSANNEAISYSWSPPDGLVCTTCQSPQALPDSSLLYVVTAQDASGCVATDSVLVTVLENTTVFVPNVLTPNGDNDNDVLTINDIDLLNATLTVFDRWGGKVFQTDDVATGWDGTSDGQLVNSGVYVYMLEMTFESAGGPFVQKGNITVLR